MSTELDRLDELDRTHWLHPQDDLAGTGPRLLFERGQGATITDATGRTYLDGMASLFNVNVGYGRAELADAASAQMRQLAYASAYGGFGSRPAIELAAKLAELAPGDLQTTFFASGGAEANDSAYKLARLYHAARGDEGRTQIVSRLRDYHGLTYGAMSATGLTSFWNKVGPLAPGFLHAPAPDPYRFEPDGSGDSPGVAYARALERVIEEAGASTVAAVVLEPVQGAGGIIVPPPEYLPEVRRVCDRHGLLLIADEVITGFGRLGRWFGAQALGFQPDLLIFAKGVTSGYLPLSGVIMTARVHETLRSLGGVLPHAFTYSGHATACAVALRNLQIMEDEGLIELAGERGDRMLGLLQALRSHSIVGDVRGRGLLAGVELVRDPATKESFEASVGAARRVMLAALEAGVIFRALPGDVIAISPPLVVSDAQVDQLVETLDAAIGQVERELL